MNSMECDVLIVGAGISGLTAAKELLKSTKEIKVLVVEAKSRVGGRTLTVDLRVDENGTAEQFDVGGQWVGQTQTHILELLKELNLETYAQYSEGRKCAQIGNSSIRTYSSSLPSVSEFRQYSIFEVLNFLRNFTKLERLVESVDLEDLYATPNAKYLDGISVEEWARQNSFYSRFMLDMVDVSTKSVYGIPAKRISMLYYLYYARSAGKLVDLFECTGNGGQAWKVKGGTQQICELLADQIGRERILLEHALTQIEVHPTSGQVTAHATSATDGTAIKITCQNAILSISPTECSHIRFQPPLSYAKKQFFDGSPQGNLLKFVVTYPTTFWRQKGWSGEILSTGWTEDSEQVHPLVCVYDGTSASGHAALVGFIHNQHWSDVSVEERRDAVLKDLARFLGDEALDFTDYIDKDWHREPFTGGCPASVAPPGNMDSWLSCRQTHPFLASRPGPVHFAGTETATLWPGYMSGAVQSGLRAAHEVLWSWDRDICDEKHLEQSPAFGQQKAPKRPDYSYSTNTQSNVSGFRLMLVISILFLLSAWTIMHYYKM